MKCGFLVRLILLAALSSGALAPQLQAGSYKLSKGQELTLMIFYGTLLSPALYLAPVAAPTLAIQQARQSDTTLDYASELELEVGVGYGLFPDPQNFHAESSSNLEATIFYRFAGLSLRSRPGIGEKQWEASIAPLRILSWKKNYEIRGLLLIGQNQLDDNDPGLIYGYQVKLETALARAHVLTRRHDLTEDLNFEFRLAIPYQGNWEPYMQAESRVGDRVGDRKGESGRRHENQYNAPRVSIGMLYHIGPSKFRTPISGT